MALIDKAGIATEDTWCYPPAQGEFSQGPLSIVHLADWGAYREQFGRTPEGVWVPGDQDIQALIPVLEQVAVVVVEFPKSRDGRGFSLARLLRERYRYEGDIRAAGPLLPDQFAMLVQCGYTSLIAPASVPLARWTEAANRSSISRPRTLLDRLSQKR